MIKPELLEELVHLRQRIHREPELAGTEKKTAEKITAFLEQHKPDRLISGIGGFGLAAQYDSGNDGPHLMFRAELDALPIRDKIDTPYVSIYDKVGHKCGHDGHMTILAGLGAMLSEYPPAAGKVTLLFQPAEETGEGGGRVVADEKFQELEPDLVFSLHNLPGFPLGQIVLREGVFAAASKGMIARLMGKTSHAAQPENGINPAPAVAELLTGLPAIPGQISDLKDLALITPIHAKLGERAFGTSPGYAEVMATLRSYLNDDMELIVNEAVTLVGKAAERANLKHTIEWTEEFPATINALECVRIVERAAENLEMKTFRRDIPFRWSEDFGHFTSRFPGIYFGIGSGENYPALHNPDYDFPDELIEKGLLLFYKIISNLTVS